MRRFSEKIRFGDLGHFSGKSNIMAFGMQCYKCDKEPGSPASVSSCPTIQFQKLCLSEKLRRTLGGYDFARSFQNIQEGSRSFEIPHPANLSRRDPPTNHTPPCLLLVQNRLWFTTKVLTITYQQICFTLFLIVQR